MRQVEHLPFSGPRLDHHAGALRIDRDDAGGAAVDATSGDACAGGAADELVTGYDYGPDSGPNTLLLRGKVVSGGGTSLRTCYRYDERGNTIAETSPRAGLTSCPAS